MIFTPSRIVWFEGQQLPDTLVPEKGYSVEDSHDNDFVLSSDDEAEDLGSDDEIIDDSK